MSFYSNKSAKALGSAKTVQENGVNNPEIMSMLQSYRRSVASAYTPVPIENIGDEIPKGELFVSTKIDGELWFLIQDDNDIALSNSKGKIIFGDFPVLNEAKESLKKKSGRGRKCPNSPRIFNTQSHFKNKKQNKKSIGGKSTISCFFVSR